MNLMSVVLSTWHPSLAHFAHVRSTDDHRAPIGISSRTEKHLTQLTTASSYVHALPLLADRQDVRGSLVAGGYSQEAHGEHQGFGTENALSSVCMCAYGVSIYAICPFSHCLLAYALLKSTIKCNSFTQVTDANFDCSTNGISLQVQLSSSHKCKETLTPGTQRYESLINLKLQLFAFIRHSALCFLLPPLSVHLLL
jgi:hypothetical protein